MQQIGSLLNANDTCTQGLASCRAPYLAIVNDYAWLAEEFIAHVITFYEDEREDLPVLIPASMLCSCALVCVCVCVLCVLCVCVCVYSYLFLNTQVQSERRLAMLSFPIIQYGVPDDYLDRGKLFNNSAVSVFSSDLMTPPRDLNWVVTDPLGPYDTQYSTFKPHWFWDGQAMVGCSHAVSVLHCMPLRRSMGVAWECCIVEESLTHDNAGYHTRRDGGSQRL